MNAASEKLSTAAKEPEAPDDDNVVEFERVFASELAAIHLRQKVLQENYSAFAPSISAAEGVGKETRRVIPAIGLALSGGGVRSAAFCLGALQALDAVLRDPKTGKKGGKPTLLERVDYLSTVSGGGCIGASLTGALSKTSGEFPFKSELDQEETDAIQHIRDHSNYLFPDGFVDVLDSIAIYMRGLLANLLIVLPVLLLPAVLTILCSPSQEDLLHPRFYRWLISYVPWPSLQDFLDCDKFGFTFALFLLSFALFLIWGLLSIVDRLTHFSAWRQTVEFCVSCRAAWRRGRARWRTFVLAKIKLLGRDSRVARFFRVILRLNPPRQSGEKNYSESRSRWARTGGYMLGLVLICALFELQPILLHRLFELAKEQPAESSVGLSLQTLTIIFTAIGAVVGFLSDKLERLTKNFAPAANWKSWFARYGGKLAIYLASAAIPLALWWIYLLASLWGIRSDVYGATNGYAAPAWLLNLAEGYADFHLGGGGIFGYLLCLPCAAQIADFFSGLVEPIGLNSSPIAGLYLAVSLLMVFLSFIPTLNANSLHKLYRDRLSTAFVFYFGETPKTGLAAVLEPLRKLVTPLLTVLLPRMAEQSKDNKIQPLDSLKLSELSARFAPYHLINTALNIQGSAYVNQRGRNADFFLLSRNFVGSDATGYVATRRMEAIASDLNLATAMAVSGAAATPNMGSGTIRPLTPTLAILNVRVGYWLRNPQAVTGSHTNRALAWLGEAANWYFFKELCGFLDERTRNVFLSDGGHIENLGVYELLRRRCKLIIAVDAEADPQMHFHSFVRLQQHARIDLGVRIDLPWHAIRNASLGAGKMIAESDPQIPNPSANGPHCAVGLIQYPKNEFGFLLYVKSSLTGDENDYILDYKRRNPSFPHETTGDQLFTEEQFEAYRALGFHALFRALNGEDGISVLAKANSKPHVLKWDSKSKTNNPLGDVRAALRW